MSVDEKDGYILSNERPFIHSDDTIQVSHAHWSFCIVHMQSLRKENGFTSGFAILLMLFFVFGAMTWGVWPKGKSFEQVTGISLPWEKDANHVGPGDGVFINMPERLQIEEWITKHQLNQYGDPANTLYAGGSPLMDETTGKVMTRYEYLLKTYPDRPWKK